MIIRKEKKKKKKKKKQPSLYLKIPNWYKTRDWIHQPELINDEKTGYKDRYNVGKTVARCLLDTCYDRNSYFTEPYYKYINSLWQIERVIFVLESWLDIDEHVSTGEPVVNYMNPGTLYWNWQKVPTLIGEKEFIKEIPKYDTLEETLCYAFHPPMTIVKKTKKEIIDIDFCEEYDKLRANQLGKNIDELL